MDTKEHAADCGVFDGVATVFRRGCTCGAHEVKPTDGEQTSNSPVARETVEAMRKTDQPLCEVREPEVPQLTESEMLAVTGKWTLVTDALPPASHEGHRKAR